MTHGGLGVFVGVPHGSVGAFVGSLMDLGGFYFILFDLMVKNVGATNLKENQRLDF